MAHRACYVALALLWAAIGAAAELPRVLIIGDSISIGYTPFVKEMLAQKAQVERIEGNAADSANVLRNLDTWLAKGPFQVVLVNCGLHDLKYTESTRAFQVPPQQYQTTLPIIIERLRATGARVVWASTTPVIDDRHARRKAGFSRYEKDVKAYNRISRRVMRRLEVPVVDLHALVMKSKPREIIAEDGVHYTEAGYRLLARRVAAGINKQLRR